MEEVLRPQGAAGIQIFQLIPILDYLFRVKASREARKVLRRLSHSNRTVGPLTPTK